MSTFSKVWFRCAQAGLWLLQTGGKMQRTDGRNVRGVEIVLSKSDDQTCFANSAVSDEQQFEKKIILFRHGLKWSCRGEKHDQKKKVAFFKISLHRLQFDSMKRADQTRLPLSSLVTGKFRSPSMPLSGLPQLKKQTHPKLAKTVCWWSLLMPRFQMVSVKIRDPRIPYLRVFLFFFLI